MIGQQIGHYEVVGRLGSGGMGVVYLARDLRLSRHVAIKVLAEGRIGDSGSRARFHKEAQALSRLNHPNIATIYDFDVHEGRDFLVMEYIEGRSLRDAGAAPRATPEVAAIGLQLAEALIAAHGAGVIHLDLKPGNLMLTADGRLKVLDFGLARLHGGGIDDGTTRTGAAFDPSTAAGPWGTPPYMAPEQVAAGPLDGRTDIYSAGATLYELATGRRVFTEPGSQGLFESILSRRPDPPSQWNRGITPALDATLLKALEKAPAARQQRAEELRADLQQAAAAEQRAGRWSRRDIILTAAGSLVAVAVTGYTMWPVRPRARFHERDFVLVGDFENGTTDPALGRAVQEALTIALQQSSFVNLVSRERVVETLRRMQRDAGATVDESTGLDVCRREAIPALVAGSVSRSGATTRIAVRVLEASSGAVLFTESVEYTAPEQLFTRVDQLAARMRTGFGESDKAVAISSKPLEKATTGSTEALRQYSIAVDARATGNFNAVEGPLLAALHLDPAFAMAHLKLGDYYMDVAGDDLRALSQIETAYALRDRVTDRERHFIAAQYFGARQQFEYARDSLKALTAIYPDDPEFRYELAVAYYALEELPLAVEELRQAIHFNPHGARAHGSLVLFLARDNQAGPALVAFSEARAAGVDSPYLYWASGLARLATGDFVGARRDFDALASGGGYFAHLARLQHGKAALLEGHIDRAMSTLSGLAELARRDGDVNTETVARVQLGHACVLLGDAAGARQQAGLVLALTTAPSTRPNLLRDAARLAHEAGDAAAVHRQLARLHAMEAAAPTNLVRAARFFVEGLVALRQRQWAAAAAAFTESRGLRQWYECRRYEAAALEHLERWRAASEAWREVVNLRGQIIQDGFPPDLRLAQTGLERAAARAGKD